MNSSKFLNLDIKDIAKSLLIAAISSFLITIYPILQSGSLPTTTQFKTAIITAIACSVSYLIKNVFTNSKNELFKKENIKK